MKWSFDHPSLASVKELLQKGESLLTEGLWDGPKALLLSYAQNLTRKNLLIITGGRQEEGDLFNDFPLFTDAPLIDFPAWETLPTEGIAPSPDVVGDRLLTLKTLSQSKEPQIVLASLQACLQKLLPKDKFSDCYFELKKGQVIPFEQFIKKLIEMGYTKTAITQDKGEFSVRGGLIDLFPVSSPDPFRIEFFDEEVESIRIFDPIGQKSIRTVDEISFTLGEEKIFVEKAETLSTILDYLGNETLIVVDDLYSLEEKWVQIKEILGQNTRTFASMSEWMEMIQSFQTIYLTDKKIHELTENIQFFDRPKFRFEMFNRTLQANYWNHPFLAFDQVLIDPDKPIESLASTPYAQQKILFLTSSDVEEKQFRLKTAEFHFTHAEFLRGYLKEGFILDDTVFFPFTELSHKPKIRRQKQRSTYHTTPFEYEEILPGELVVHLNNGIGKFIGMEKKPNIQGIPTEYLAIEYAEGGKLFVPLDQSYLVSKYIGSHDETPRLHVIGSSRWKHVREKTEMAIKGYAKELLEVYAQRDIKGGFSYPEDGLEMHMFEEDFPYVETEDQLHAIAAIKNDMHDAKAMDRLICGDVGYGKTEVAMRAAFKAVVEGGKQVAVLVPTTILALQHFETFSSRMESFPIRIGHISRFVNAKRNRQVIEELKEGKIDIVIGTHRLVSEDVTFKDLGLVIIDEEQRFGVRAKEHLKKIRVGVDCLTLSATPIPRTLYLSMIGIRDVSVINTPPQDRLPIKTIVAEPSENLIQTALIRELNRDGQAYVIHNRVESIFEFGNKIQKMIPNAKIVIAHGQMSGEEIDSAFHQFKSGQADILIATTIVENGIDIPNANTILIDHADKLGIADLYQLRGRVGRWNRRAFCYFLVQRMERLPDIARKRLEAMTQSSGHGGGMKVALRDLELRGAGDILGLDQSGHVSQIGFHLYCSLLKKTIKALRGELPKSYTDCKVEIGVEARFPEDYINEVTLRMEFYRRLGEALTEKEVEEIFREIIDRFGPLPKPADNLKWISLIRVFGSMHKATHIKLENLRLSMEYKKGGSIEKKIWLFRSTTGKELLLETILKEIQSFFK